MGCVCARNQPARVPRVSEGPQDLSEYVSAALRRLARDESVIPCEHSGVLHSNHVGPTRGFCSVDAMREYHSMHVERIRKLNSDILQHWHRLDADFTLQYFSNAGAALPPYRKLQPKIRQAMQKSEAHYRKVFEELPEEDRELAAQFEHLWPLASTAEELKESCMQLDEAMGMRSTYACGVQRLELLHHFSVGLARCVGAARKVEWSVKRPWRLWRKTIESYPEEFAEHDFRHCNDVFRTSIIVDTMEQIQQMLNVLESLGRDAYDRDAVLRRLGMGGSRAHFCVERIKNRFVEPCPGGYMDIIANLRINGYVTEIQLHLRQILDVKGETGRHLYKWYRAFIRETNQYAGERAEDGRMHGTGTFYPVSGGRYDGEFRDGQRHGEGTFYYPNGDRYDGEFVEGKKHGTGTFSYASGDRYTGNFAEDRMDGTGVFYFVNGERFEGEYCEGKRHGEGAYYYNNGNCVRGQWWRNKHVSVVSV